MSTIEESAVRRLHDNASKRQLVDEIIRVHVRNKDYYPAKLVAKLMRPDGKLKPSESEVFIRAFADEPTRYGKRYPKACEVAEEHYTLDKTIERLLHGAAENGCTEGFVRALALLNREATIAELETLRDSIVRR